MKKNGFTLVEILVAMGILTMVMTFSSMMLYSTYKGARKAGAIAQAKSEGAYAMKAMSNLISFGTKISCNLVPNSLVVTRLNGDQVTYSLTGKQIASTSGLLVQNLTSTNVAVVPCSGTTIFSCNAATGAQTVNICFNINRANSIDVTDSAGLNGVNFQSQVTLENFGN